MTVGVKQNTAAITMKGHSPVYALDPLTMRSMMAFRNGRIRKNERSVIR